MRVVHHAERSQRACYYCIDQASQDEDGKKLKTKRCPYDECPYHEMDGYKTYGDYLKATGGNTVTKLLKTLGLGK